VLTPVSGIMGYCTDLLKYQDFLSMNCILKELYCIYEAPTDTIKAEF